MRLGRPALMDARKIATGVAGALVIFLVIPPIGVLLFSTFRATENRLPFEATSFTLSNFSKVFASRVTYDLLLNTLWYAVGATALGLVIATVFAWFLERTNMPFRRALFVLTLLPMGIPGLVLSMAWILLANPTNGVFNVALRGLFGLETSQGPLNIYSVSGMILVTATRYVPIMYIMISGVFSRLDPSFEEASSTSGAGGWATFRHISVPLLSPALLAAVIYFFMMSIEVFETAALLGMPRDIYVFSTRIYYAVHPPQGLPNYGLASSYSVMILIAAIVLIYLYRRYVRHAERFATVTGRGYRPRLISLGKWRLVPVVLILGYSVFAIGIPFLMLVWKSLTLPYASISFSALLTFTSNNYRTMLSYQFLWIAARNTLVIGGATACLTMLLVTMVSWLSVRRGGLIPKVSEYLTFLILGVPGVVLALALIFIYASFPIGIYGTIWIIVLGLTTVCLPFGTRLMSAAFLQIHRELEEAAATSGAGLWNTFVRIVIPLLWPSFTRGLLWVFVRCVCDATIPLMLYAAGNQTIAVALWNLWNDLGDFPLASAIAVPLVLLSSGLALLVARQTMLVEGST